MVALSWHTVSTISSLYRPGFVFTLVRTLKLTLTVFPTSIRLICFTLLEPTGRITSFTQSQENIAFFKGDFPTFLIPKTMLVFSPVQFFRHLQFLFRHLI